MVLTWLDLSFIITIALTGSFHCASMCGGIYCSIQKAPTSNFLSKNVLQYFLGRLISYTWIGALLGSFGLALGNNFNTNQALLRILSGGIGSLLIIGGIFSFFGLSFGKTTANLVSSTIVKSVSVFFASSSPYKKFRFFFFGAISGIIPCGLMWSVGLKAMSTGSLVKGAIIMCIFCILTSISIFLTGLVYKYISPKITFRSYHLAEITIVFMGSQILYNSIYGFSLFSCVY